MVNQPEVLFVEAISHFDDFRYVTRGMTSSHVGGAPRRAARILDAVDAAPDAPHRTAGSDINPAAAKQEVINAELAEAKPGGNTGATPDSTPIDEAAHIDDNLERRTNHASSP